NVDATAVALVDATTDYAYILGVEPLSVTRIRTVDVTTRTNIIDQATMTYTNATYDFTDVVATVYAGTRYLFLPTGLNDNVNFGLLKVRHLATMALIGSAFDDADYVCNFVAVKPVTTGTDSVYVLGQAKMYLEPPPPFVLMAVRISDLFKQGESAYERGYVADVNLDSLGTTAYVADGIRLVSYDLSTPTTPVKGEAWNIPGAPTGAASNGPYVFAAAGALGFHLVNAGLPYPPTIASDNPLDNLAGIGIAVRGTTVFMSVGAPSTPGIQAYDVTNPLAPVTIGFTPLAGPGEIVISGDYLLVANGSTLKVLDISNPTLPLPQVGSVNSRYGSMSSIAVSGDLAFLTGSSFQSFDISDPANPIYRGIHDSDGGGVNGVAGRGRMAYVAEGAYFQPNSLKLLDLSNPAVPVLVDQAITSGMTVESVTLEGPWAFVTDSFPDMGLWAATIDPASPSFLAAYGPCDVAPGAEAGWAEAVFSSGGWAYVTFDSATVQGLSVVDVADPTALGSASLKYSLELGGEPRGLAISGRYGYVANGSLGLQVIQIAP
ncbi:MAG TPA: hypothetical protein VLH81_10380, partial [Desulfobacterales bacterium]|nr:hypothetical protein [Desulfobacterales bacterium]